MLMGFKWQKKTEYYLSFCAICVFALYLLSKSNSVRTVWELGDEAGYISNAAFLCGYNWSCVFEVNSFYNIGYSIMLIPAFLLSGTGEQLIHYCICTNIFIVLVTAIIIIYLLGHLLELNNVLINTLISIVVCSNPYLVSNCLKINCECLCFCSVCIVYLLLFFCSGNSNLLLIIMLGMALGYMPFIHTRLLVVSIPLCIYALGLILFLKGQNTQHKRKFLDVFAFILSYGVTYVVLWIIKNNILSYISSVRIEQDTPITNVVTANSILSWFLWLIDPSNFNRYWGAFIQKVYSMNVISMGLYGLGLYLAIRHCFNLYAERQNAKILVLSPFVLSILMILACIFTGTAATSFNNFVYTRYFEYVVLLSFAFSLALLFYNKVPIKIGPIILFLSALIGKICLSLSNLFESTIIGYDTARIPDYSLGISISNEYNDMFVFEIMITTIICMWAIISTSDRWSNIFTKFTLLFLVAYITFKNTDICTKEIIRINNEQYADTAMANKIYSCFSANSHIYILDDDSYRFRKYYMRMQCLLKDIPLITVLEDDIEKITDLQKGDFVIIYKTNPHYSEYKNENLLFFEGATFSSIYIK
ncbi:hypothetical protein [Butyrivibrio fibrisolvens]|uniref:hypothetical protein n=1 Tax=Butyrivibrio fibrisolvens TaxID=831 RepID=UPI0003F907FF|nr:hypothetical protein [Butyrivibrio fibrisolvens]